MYEQRGALQREFVGSLPDLEQTWSIKARNKQYMARERYNVLLQASKEKQERIDQFKKDFDYDNIMDYIMEDITPPSSSMASEPVVIDPAKPAVNKTKQMIPDFIPIDILTDPKALDALIIRSEKIAKNQTPAIKEDIARLADVVQYQIANGNPDIIYNMSSLYSLFFQRADRTIDLIQDVSGLRLKYFVNHMENVYGPSDAYNQIRRNKEMINQAEKELYVDISQEVPLKTFVQYAKENNVFTKMLKDKELFRKTNNEYREYVLEWTDKNEGSLTKLADNTIGKLFKDADAIVYGYNKKVKQLYLIKIKAL